MSTPDSSRRAFVKQAAYVTPVILTLPIAPDYAKAGSVKNVGGGRTEGKDKVKSKG